MRVTKMLAIGVVLCLFGSLARAEEKVDYPKLIVGTWEVTKADPGTVPAGSAIEFTKDGKLKVKHKKGGEDLTIDGTYTLEKNVFTMKVKLGDEERTHAITITKISDKAMSTKDKDDKVVELEKKK
jgi:uncharacterized protein (TIGR03066 family)